MEKITLKVQKRSIQGRKVNGLRNKGILPANVFGRDVASEAIQVDLKEFKTILSKAGETNIVELTLEKGTKPVLINNVQYNPITDDILHVDFLQVDLKKKVSADVPVELVGVSPAEKQSVGTVVQYVNEIKVETLPSEIPDKFEIDISNLSEVDQMIQIKDLKIDVNKIKIEEDPDSIIVKVEPPKEEKEEVSVPVVSEAIEGVESTDSSSSDKTTNDTKTE